MLKCEWRLMVYIVVQLGSLPGIFITLLRLNCTIHGREIQLFCYITKDITNSWIVENENGSVTWSIIVINTYDAIFSNSLGLSARQWSFVLRFQLVKTGSWMVETGFTQYLLFHYSQEEMIFSVCLSSLIQTETNIVSNKCLHYLVRASHDSGLLGTIFLFHEWRNSVAFTQQSP